jgi:predicted nucleic acid-binding Zn ribbon protein
MDNRTVASAHSAVQKTQANLTMHEAVCAERWAEMLHRVKRIEMIMLSTAGASLLLLISLVVKS